MQGSRRAYDQANDELGVVEGLARRNAIQPVWPKRSTPTVADHRIEPDVEAAGQPIVGSPLDRLPKLVGGGLEGR